MFGVIFGFVAFFTATTPIASGAVTHYLLRHTRHIAKINILYGIIMLDFIESLQVAASNSCWLRSVEIINDPFHSNLQLLNMLYLAVLIGDGPQPMVDQMNGILDERKRCGY